jgi:hypothetical protein
MTQGQEGAGKAKVTSRVTKNKNFCVCVALGFELGAHTC